MTDPGGDVSSNPGGYGQWAWTYRERQWVSVLPLPYRKKTPPPSDYTGQIVKKTGLAPHIPDDDQIAKWVAEHQRGNLALRMPGDVIGIDVDAYEYEYHAKGDDKKPLHDEHGHPVMAWGLKTGDITVAEMEDKLGELPATWRSSSRTEGVSGIRFYRVPASLLWRDVGEHVETIWWGHRYAAVWPSINPDSNARYMWFDENSPEEGWGSDIPKVIDLPELPEAWVRHLSAETVEQTPPGAVPAATRADRPRSLGGHDPGQPRLFTRKQAAEFVQPHLDELRHATVGTINNRLNDAAKTISHFVPTVWRPDEADALLWDALRATAYDGKSWKAARTIESAFDSTVGDWVAQLVAEAAPPPGGARTRPRGSEGDPWPTEPPDATPPEVAGFWETRPALSFIRDFALSRYAAPWAVLGATLARAVACVEPNIQLPAVIGTEASLNLFVGLVGPSGGGKDIAVGVSKALLLPVEGRDPVPLDVIPLGSGEGLSHIYMKLPPKLSKRAQVDEDSAAIGLGFTPGGPIQYRTRSLVNIAEIDTMGSLTQRSGSTIGGQLRQAWSGQQLGFQYVGEDKRMIVPEHSYRMCLTAGIQPGRAGVLLDETDGGTPQRFLWLPATNGGLEEPTDEQIDNPPPPIPGAEWTPLRYQAKVVLFDVCVTARRTIVRAHVARGRGEGDALDGHSLLNRLKTAAALAILCGTEPSRQCEVTEEDWELAGVIMAVSDATRAGVQRVLVEQARVENEKKGAADARRTLVADEVVETVGMRKAVNWLRGRIGADWVTERELNRGISSKIRDHLGQALEKMLGAGEIESEEYHASTATALRYRRKG